MLRGAGGWATGESGWLLQVPHRSKVRCQRSRRYEGSRLFAGAGPGGAGHRLDTALHSSPEIRELRQAGPDRGSDENPLPGAPAGAGRCHVPKKNHPGETLPGAFRGLFVCPGQQVLAYPITCNGAGDGVAGYPIDFDPKGLANRRCSICVEGGAGVGEVDSVKVSPSRISLGKKDKGDECKAENITAR